MKSRYILFGGLAVALGATQAATAGESSVSGLNLQPQPINTGQITPVVNPSTGNPVNPVVPVSTSASDLRSDSSSTLEGTAAPVGVVNQTAVTTGRTINFGSAYPIKPSQTIYGIAKCDSTAARISTGANRGFGYTFGNNGTDGYIKGEIYIPFGQGKCKERQERLAKINDEKHMSAMIDQCIKWAKQGFTAKHCKDYGISSVQVAQAPPPQQPVYHPPILPPPPPPVQRVVHPTPVAPPPVKGLWFQEPIPLEAGTPLEAPVEIPVNY